MDENNVEECGTIQDEFDKMVEGIDNIKDIQEYKIMRFAMCVGNENREGCMDFSAADYYRCNGVGRMIRTNLIDYVDYIKQGKSEQDVNAAADIYENDCMHEVGLMAGPAEAESFCGNMKNVANMLWEKLREAEIKSDENLKTWGIVMGCAVGIICLITAAYGFAQLLKGEIQERIIKQSAPLKELKEYERAIKMEIIENSRYRSSRRVVDIDNKPKTENKHETMINSANIQESINLEGSKKTAPCQLKESSTQVHLTL